MYFQLIKIVTNLAYLCLVGLTWLFLDGGLDWRFAGGCIFLSGLWLILTRLHMGRLLETYFDILSRLEVVLPTFLGVSLSLTAVLTAPHPALRVVAALELGGWAYIFLKYKRNRALYEIQGHGPLPRGTWVSPPADALLPGDLMLTSGRVAARLHETVGHGEMVIVCPRGTKMAFSSYMAKGLVINALDEIAASSGASGHYIILRLCRALSADDVASMWRQAASMHEENIVWKETVNTRNRKIIESLPMPEATRDRLARALTESGYDWLGLFMGRLARHRWTCVGACLELYRRLDIRTNRYGTGLLGFGTGLFDPIMPVRFLSDPAFRLLTEKDRDQWMSAER